jgi:lysozyme family protein
MDNRFEKMVDFIIENEGGYVNHPNDPGGATKYGISLRFYRNLKPDATKKDITNITKQDAIDIYYKHWYSKYNYDAIEDDILSSKVFDFSINMGPARAHKIFQTSINAANKEKLVVVDGIIGPATLSHANNSDPVKLVDFLALNACKYYLSLCENNEANYKFIVGWINRALKRTALKYGGYSYA